MGSNAQKDDFITLHLQIKGPAMRRKAKFSHQFYKALKQQDLNWMNISVGDQRDYRDAAYTIYRNVHRLGLPFILLGDTQIREQQELLQAFGVLSRDDDVQEASARDKIEKANRFRRARNLRLARQEYRMATRTGSILSTSQWSPILNDTMMIAGAETGKCFQFTLSPFEITQFEIVKRRWIAKVEKQGKLANQKGLAMEDPRKPAKNPRLVMTPYWQRHLREDLWRNFFRRWIHPLWDCGAGLPRVLARELLGLKVFGYKPDFHYHSMTFERVHQRDIGFAEYHDELRSSGYIRNNNERPGGNCRRLLRTLGEYLFGDSRSLLQNQAFRKNNERRLFVRGNNGNWVAKDDATRS